MALHMCLNASHRQADSSRHMVEGVGVHLGAVGCTMGLEVGEEGGLEAVLGQDLDAAFTDSYALSVKHYFKQFRYVSKVIKCMMSCIHCNEAPGNRSA
jgi:hypothetical protein